MFEFKTGAKIVQIERKTKLNLSFSEMQPIFDLILRSEVGSLPLNNLLGDFSLLHDINPRTKSFQIIPTGLS